ncbi:FxLD family lanthipeptide [Streptomyces sp. W16]|uniref:FxLD family lanthipeptide n=1 Tax=Streptomyces sp. W16 TaxID=3076631 RepID=UPI00295B3F4A|nr:FxLD family lanthipeptide [Streptomyces sp. W16]MDV9174120.1 FxLD family lanthipeptide [Streptomyces sp. W16]
MITAINEHESVNADTSLDDWKLDVIITDSPTVVPADCGTGDGCAGTCASACAS